MEEKMKVFVRTAITVSCMLLPTIALADCKPKNTVIHSSGCSNCTVNNPDGSTTIGKRSYTVTKIYDRCDGELIYFNKDYGDCGHC